MTVTTPNLKPTNYFATTLSSNIGTTDTTIYLNSIPPNSEGFLEIGEGLATKEIVYFTSVGSNFVTLPSAVAGRGVGGTSAASHNSGETVKQKLNAEWWIALQNGNSINWSSAPTIANGLISTKTLTNPSKFRVYRSADQASYLVTGNTFYKIQFDTKDYDTGSNYDNATNYRFTAPVAGFYHFDVIVTLKNGSTALNISMQLYKNGSSTGAPSVVTPTIGGGQLGDTNIQLSDTIQLAANDYIEVWLASSTSGIGVDGTLGRTRFSGFLVSQT